MTTTTTRLVAVIKLANLLVIAACMWIAWPQSLHGSVAYVRVDGHSMDPTLHNGDLSIVRRQSSYEVGDAVAYKIPRGEFGAGALVIHRLIGGDGARGYVTRGDNRNIVDPWHPRTADIIGRVRWNVAGAGTKLTTLASPINLGGLVAGLTVMMMLLPTGEKKRADAAAPDGVTPAQMA
jgi:signal peptidase